MLYKATDFVAMSLSQALTVVIPAYNEESSIASVIADVRQTVGADVPIIVVDDGSTDNTAPLIRELGVVVLVHARNTGYGSALKTGVRHAVTPFVATFDGDGQHSGAALWALWERRADGDMIVGARSRLMHSPSWRMPGKWFLHVMAVYLTRQLIPDLNSGLRLYRRDVLARYLHVCPAGFSFSTTMTLALLSRGWRVVYVPVEVSRRIGRSSVTLATGFETIVLILRVVSLFNPLRIFVPAAAISALVGVLWGVPYVLRSEGVSIGAMLAIVTGVILFALGLLCDQISSLRLERFE
jgi:glycosyltransferase involved in cell wall biosynthesis